MEEFIKSIDELLKEDNKELFTEKYSEISEKIKMIDNKLNETNNYKDKNIEELLTMLEYETLEDNIESIKKMKDIIEVIEINLMNKK